MEVTFWGVRGSSATPDPDKLRYGGNTSSIVLSNDRLPNDFYVLDAGTGLARFGENLALRKPCRATVLISHLHLYHIIGFQFTPLAYSPYAETLVIGPSTRNFALESVFDHIMSPSYSPVYGLQNLKAKVVFEEVSTAPRQVGEVLITAESFEHSPDTKSWGYRLEYGGGALVYLTDAVYRLSDGTLDRRAIRLAAGADALLAGAFDPAHERPRYPTYSDVFDLARAAKVKRIFLTHHHQDANDDDLDRAGADAQHANPDLDITLAAEGMTVRL